MTTRYTQNELAAMERNLDREKNDLLAEILTLASNLARLVGDAYKGEYQEHPPTLNTHYRRPFHDILDGIRLLGNQAGTLITAGRQHDDEQG